MHKGQRQVKWSGLYEQANLELHCPHTSEDPFSHDAVHIIMFPYGFPETSMDARFHPSSQGERNRNGRVNHPAE